MSNGCLRCGTDGVIDDDDLGTLEPQVRCGDPLWGIDCGEGGCGSLLCPDCQGTGSTTRRENVETPDE